MLKDVHQQTEERMKKSIDMLRKDLASLRAGRASTALLDRVMVDYYGTPTPIVQMANVSVPEPRMLVIQPWDKTAMGSIEKAILKSDLGLTPNNDGQIIRLNIPQLTTERRNELVKVAHKKTEEIKVAVRNERRDAVETVKKLQKDGHITEDELKKAQEDIQKLTDKYIAEVDKVLAVKEKEIMEV